MSFFRAESIVLAGNTMKLIQLTLKFRQKRKKKSFYLFSGRYRIWKCLLTSFFKNKRRKR